MNNEEIWKDIIGYEGLYQVSSLGRVRSLDRYDSNNHFLKGRILKLSANGKGYLKVALNSNGKAKTYSVHRLVLQSFIPNPDNLPQVNHKDENKTNNNVDNLEWCDNSYNLNYGTRKIRERNTKLKNGYWSGLSSKEYRNKYYQENKDKIKKYYQEHKKECIEQQREYYQKNRDRICEQQKEYYRKKKEIQNNA